MPHDAGLFVVSLWQTDMISSRGDEFHASQIPPPSHGSDEKITPSPEDAWSNGITTLACKTRVPPRPISGQRPVRLYVAKCRIRQQDPARSQGVLFYFEAACTFSIATENVNHFWRPHECPFRSTLFFFFYLSHLIFHHLVKFCWLLVNHFWTALQIATAVAILQ